MTDALDELPLWSTPRELAKRWPASKSTITRWLDAGKLKGKRFGAKWGVHRDTVRAFEKDGMPEAPAAAMRAAADEWANLPEYV